MALFDVEIQESALADGDGGGPGSAED
jgi:hypothetical protein